MVLLSASGRSSPTTSSSRDRFPGALRYLPVIENLVLSISTDSKITAEADFSAATFLAASSSACSAAVGGSAGAVAATAPASGAGLVAWAQAQRGTGTMTA